LKRLSTAWPWLYPSEENIFVSFRNREQKWREKVAGKKTSVSATYRFFVQLFFFLFFHRKMLKKARTETTRLRVANCVRQNLIYCYYMFVCSKLETKKKFLKGDETKIILNDKSSLKTDIKAAKACAV
jgi:hypothetical protein